MATSHAERWMALCCVALLSAGATAAQIRADDEITIEGENLRIDYGRSTLQMSNVIMKNRDGTMLIRAQEAKSRGVELSARDMQLEFSGNVHIEVDGAILDSATATVTVKNNRLETAHAVGTPAQFSHLLKGATQRSQGRARNIDYDAARSQLRLSGAVWYSDGRNDINTSTLNYNMSDRSIDSNPGAGERVLLHLQMGDGNAPGSKAPPKSATPATPATTPPASSKK